MNENWRKLFKFLYWIEISLIGRNNDDANGLGMRILEEQVNAL